MDFQNTSPFGKLGAILLILLTTFIQAIKTLCGALAISSSEGDNSLVDLDAGDDSELVEGLREWGSRVILLVEGLMEQNHTADVLGQGGTGAEEQLTVSATVLLVVLTSNWSKTLANGSCALISSQDSLAGSCDGIGNLAEFILLLLGEVPLDRRATLDKNQGRVGRPRHVFPPR